MAIEQCPLNSCGAESYLELLNEIGIIVYSAHDESRTAERVVLGEIGRLAHNLKNGKILPANCAHMESVPYVAQVYISLASGRIGDLAWKSLPDNYVPVVVMDDILNSSAEILYSEARLKWLIRGRRNITHIFLVEWSDLRVHVDDSHKRLVLMSEDLKIKK